MPSGASPNSPSDIPNADAPIAGTTPCPTPVPGPTPTPTPAPAPAPPPPAVNPPYEPGRWNTQPVKGSTNCYAYAANDPDGHPPGKPQPGERCGHPTASESCPDVGAAAVCDGMIKGPATGPPSPPPGYYPVALVSAPGVDYHWYRLDDNGRWSHKPGSTNARDVDASGNPITNPETANRDYSPKGPNYSNFCGYFYVPAGGLRTGPTPP